MRTWVEPSPSLREFVRCYLHVHEMRHARPVLPVLDTKLAFFRDDPCRVFDYRLGEIDTLARAVVIGPQTRRWVDLCSSRRSVAMFVVFQPGGFHRLFGHDTSTLADHAYAADAVLGPGFSGTLERVDAAETADEMIAAVENYLRARVSQARSLDVVDRAAHALLSAHGGIRTQLLVEHSGFGERQFRRQFVEHAGMPPKHYAKVARFTFALALKAAEPSLTWAEVSQRAGYFDQMHLVKDFKALTAIPPSRLLDQIDQSTLLPFEFPRGPVAAAVSDSY